MKVLIVDDEMPARDRLKRLLEAVEGYEIIGEAENGLQALDLCNVEPPDVVLLDIRMPGIDGIETAQHLNAMENPPAVIFTTAYNEYAIDAFDAQAIGYLMKPVRQARLARALKHAARLSSPQLSAIANSDTRKPRQHICARVRNQLLLICLEDIYYFQADQKYTRVVYQDGEVLIDESLKTLEEDLGDHVLRVHRSALVMRNQLAALDKERDGTYSARLRDCQDRLNVSRRLISPLRKAIKAG